MHSSYAYAGKELALFQNAKNWKKYFSSFIKPYINGTVVEVGPGLGVNTRILNDGTSDEWILLEPDKEMAEFLSRNDQLPLHCKIINGTIDQLKGKKVNTIIYIDVLEHIMDDKTEIQKAANLLAPGGHLIILAPAFNFIFSSFDNAIGHYRRYRKKSLKILMADFLFPVRLHYLDSVGFFMSLSNRMLLRQKYPTHKQVAFWDRYIISLSKIIDKLVVYSFGKTILGIWKKPID